MGHMGHIHLSAIVLSVAALSAVVACLAAVLLRGLRFVFPGVSVHPFVFPFPFVGEGCGVGCGDPLEPCLVVGLLRGGFLFGRVVYGGCPDGAL